MATFRLIRGVFQCYDGATATVGERLLVDEELRRRGDLTLATTTSPRIVPLRQWMNAAETYRVGLKEWLDGELDYDELTDLIACAAGKWVDTQLAEFYSPSEFAREHAHRLHRQLREGAEMLGIACRLGAHPEFWPTKDIDLARTRREALAAYYDRTGLRPPQFDAPAP